jgi:hypothetical protein
MMSKITILPVPFIPRLFSNPGQVLHAFRERALSRIKLYGFGAQIFHKAMLAAMRGLTQALVIKSTPFSQNPRRPTRHAVFPRDWQA